MRTLSYAMNVSLDGYVAAPGGDVAWGVPSDELFTWWTERVATTELALYGRGMWETMAPYWPRADEEPDATTLDVEYAARWREMPKVVFSSTLTEVEWNARLVDGDAVGEIARLKAEGDGRMDVCGARLAGAALQAGLVDELVLVTVPLLLGDGQRFLPPLEQRTSLALVERRDFPGGVLMTRYEVAGA